jgi:hypothetical protein
MKPMEPGLRPLIYPPTCLGSRVPAFFLHFVAARLDVPLVVTTLQPSAEVRCIVCLVGAQMLGPSRRWLRPMDRHVVHGRQGQLQIVLVRRPDCQAQNDAAAIGEHRPLHSQLASIGRIGPGFFPLPVVLWSSSCRVSATARRCVCGDRIRPNPVSKVCGTRPAHTMIESNDADCCPSRIPSARPSKGSRFASHSKCRPRRDAGPRAAVHPADAASVLAITCSVDATSPPATDDTNLQ